MKNWVIKRLGGVTIEDFEKWSRQVKSENDKTLRCLKNRFPNEFVDHSKFHGSLRDIFNRISDRSIADKSALKGVADILCDILGVEYQPDIGDNPGGVVSMAGAAKALMENTKDQYDSDLVKIVMKCDDLEERLRSAGSS